MKRHAIALLILLVSMAVASGCDDKAPGLTEPNTPVARFISTVTEAASSFLVRITNQSVNHSGGTINLSYLWVVEQQDNAVSLNPEYLYTYQMLGMSEVGNEAIRRFLLTVTEGNDASRTSQSEQNILFTRAKGGSVTALAVSLAPWCNECPVYRGSVDFSGERFYLERYRVDRVLSW